MTICYLKRTSKIHTCKTYSAIFRKTAGHGGNVYILMILCLTPFFYRGLFGQVKYYKYIKVVCVTLIIHGQASNVFLFVNNTKKVSDFLTKDI